jgi:hypothetical protein
VEVVGREGHDRLAKAHRLEPTPRRHEPRCAHRQIELPGVDAELFERPDAAAEQA